jgi:hypothetical protein
MENFQTTPFGLWKRAKEYSEGAKAVAEKTAPEKLFDLQSVGNK